MVEGAVSPESGQLEWPDRIPVVGTPISATTIDDLLAIVDQRPADRATVVAFCNVHSVMTARRRPELAAALESADVAAPDGVPLVWGLRAAGRSDQPRVAGPDFFEGALQHGVPLGWTHFFIGSTEDTLRSLTGAARTLAPGVQIAGTYSPPFRPTTEDDIREQTDLIKESGAGMVWVGLGMPKQELWMQQAASHLPGRALLGVGAAFDFLAGNVSRAPEWMQAAGLEWLYRLWKEPRRLWRRYIINNPLYLWLLGKDMLRRRFARRG